MAPNFDLLVLTPRLALQTNPDVSSVSHCPAYHQVMHILQLLTLVLCTAILAIEAANSEPEEDQNVEDCVPRPDIQPRNITGARLDRPRFSITWSDCVTNYANITEEDDSCIYKGVMEDDSKSSVLVTGCKEIDVQIHSEVYGDWIFTVRNGSAMALVIDDVPHWEPDYETDYEENKDFYLEFPIRPENVGRH
eukprot:GFUD01034641.1.p1 GENE.GFUD01034641.1~~GFUD01034641.1.p1  ORF type:complete len:206 (-),score=38.87 GFUD01034641.1:82-660(-)